MQSLLAFIASNEQGVTFWLNLIFALLTSSPMCIKHISVKTTSHNKNVISIYSCLYLEVRPSAGTFHHAMHKHGKMQKWAGAWECTVDLTLIKLDTAWTAWNGGGGLQSRLQRKQAKITQIADPEPSSKKSSVILYVFFLIINEGNVLRDVKKDKPVYLPMISSWVSDIPRHLLPKKPHMIAVLCP